MHHRSALQMVWFATNFYKTTWHVRNESQKLTLDRKMYAIFVAPWKPICCAICICNLLWTQSVLRHRLVVADALKSHSKSEHILMWRLWSAATLNAISIVWVSYGMLIYEYLHSRDPWDFDRCNLCNVFYLSVGWQSVGGLHLFVCEVCFRNEIQYLLNINIILY